MPEVVFFDCVARGLKLFSPIAEYLRQQGIESVGVHLGSMYDPRVPEEEIIQGIQCRDIRFYGSIRNAIERESPKVVLTTDTRTLDRILHRICRTYGIKSAYLMHGILATGEEDRAEFTRITDRSFNLRERIARVPRNIRLFKWYLDAIRRESYSELFRPSNYGFFVQVISSPGAAFFFAPWRHKDVYADKALVYAESYRRLFIETCWYPADHVVVVGNPNLDPVFELLKNPQASIEAREYIIQIGVPVGTPAVVYMEDAFAAQQGAGGWTVSTLIDEIRSIAGAVKQAGMHLIVKLHPATDPEPIVQAFSREDGIHILANADLPKLIFGCIATLGHVSTPLIISIVYNRPVLVPGWSLGVNKLGYFVRQGVAIQIASPEELACELSRILVSGPMQTETDARKQFMADFVTHLDGQSQNRINSEIIRLIVGSGTRKR